MNRKRLSIVLSSILVLAMLLTACGGEETTTALPSTNVPPVTAESTATQDMTATEAPTSADLTTTPGVPVTGENNPSRLSNLMDAMVWNQNNEQVGVAQDFVLDLDNVRISYVVVATGGFADLGDKTVLIPWDMLQLQTGAGGNTGESGFILLADPEFLNNAPDVDLSSTLPAMGQPAGNWDVDIRNFWDTGTLPSGSGTATSTGTDTGTAAPGTAATATSGTGTGTGNETATPSAAGTGTGLRQAMQGVILASDVLGATITIGGGQGTGTGTGTGQNATATPATTATVDTGTGTSTGSETATATSSGSGTGTGNAAGATQGTVEDLIIDPANGDFEYLVIRTSDDDTRLIPVPIGFLQWDATANGFVLMIDANALQNAPAFGADQFPDTSTEGWDQEFSTFWQNNGGAGTGTGTGGVTASTATPTP